MTSPRTGTVGLAEDLARERTRIVVSGRSAPYARALQFLPRVLAGPPGRYVAAAWSHRTFLAPHDRPLLLLAALRADARAAGPGHPLWSGFAAPAPREETVTEAALAEALDGSRDRVFDALAHRSVSTNETSRAVSWLWPAALAGASGGARALALADVGASAGLNLVADALPPTWSAEDGQPLAIAHDVHAVARLGLDAAPLDALRPEDAEWLRACVWPGDPARAARLEQALAAYRAARPRPDAPVLVPIAARNVPARLDLLSGREPAALVLAYQTVVRDYLEPAERTEYETGMRNWLGAHPPGRALWVELEPVDGAGPAAGGAIVAHVRSSSGALVDLELARCDLHPERLQVDRVAEARLAALLVREPAIAGAPA